MRRQLNKLKSKSKNLRVLLTLISIAFSLVNCGDTLLPPEEESAAIEEELPPIIPIQSRTPHPHVESLNPLPENEEPTGLYILKNEPLPTIKAIPNDTPSEKAGFIVQATPTTPEKAGFIIQATPTTPKKAGIIIQATPTTPKKAGIIIQATPTTPKKAGIIVQATPTTPEKAGTIVQAIPNDTPSEKAGIIVQAIPNDTPSEKAGIIVQAIPNDTPSEKAGIIVQAIPNDTPSEKAGIIIQATPTTPKKAGTIVQAIPNDTPSEKAGIIVQATPTTPEKAGFVKIIEYLEPIFFDVDSHELSDLAKGTLDKHIQRLIDYPYIKNIILEGYCDDSGTREHNQKLGAQRTESVKKYFLEYLLRQDIPEEAIKIFEEKIGTESYGEDRPLEKPVRDLWLERYGENKPLSESESENDSWLDRRVSFTLVEPEE